MNEAEFQRYLNAKAPLEIHFAFRGDMPQYKLFSLRLEDKGFHIGFVFYNFYPWESVSEFIVQRLFSSVIRFDDNRRQGPVPWLTRLLQGGYTGTIPAYSFAPNFTPEQVAALMNHWRSQALGDKNQPSAGEQA